MALTVESLLKYTEDAREPMKVGISYDAENKSEGWSVASEIKDGALTGRIVVTCTDETVRKGFVTEARRAGHKVRTRFGRAMTLFVTLKEG
jgi:hypothetical protein